MVLEDNTSPINPDIHGFETVEYSVRSKSGCAIALRYQAQYIPGLPNYFYIIYPKCILTPEGYKGTFIYHFHGENDRYVDINLKEENPG